VKDRWRHVPAILIAVVFLFPLYLMVSGSLRPAGGPPPRTPDLVPSTLAWENYSRAFELVDMPRYIVNSLIVVAFAAPLTVVEGAFVV
jgi:multiple sugar transport system permease protein